MWIDERTYFLLQLEKNQGDAYVTLSESQENLTLKKSWSKWTIHFMDSTTLHKKMIIIVIDKHNSFLSISTTVKKMHQDVPDSLSRNLTSKKR